MDVSLTEAEWIELSRLVELAEPELMARLLSEASEALGRIPTPVDDDGGFVFDLVAGPESDQDARVRRAMHTRTMPAYGVYRYLLDRLREHATR